jgi:predicted nucleic acid-binding protein
VKFWDASAVVPLLVSERSSPVCATLAASDAGLVVWWATRVECGAALWRRIRDGSLAPRSEPLARKILESFATAWLEVAPTAPVRDAALRLVRAYPLRASDSLQLGAALAWCEGVPAGRCFVSLDDRLRDAALREGFTVLP